MPPPVLLPNVQEHLGKSAHNYRLYEQLRDGGEFLDWAVVALFYSVLHLVDAYAVQNREPGFRNHEQRNFYVRRELRRIWPDYHELYDASRQARYGSIVWQPKSDQIRNAHSAQQKVRSDIRQELGL